MLGIAPLCASAVALAHGDPASVLSVPRADEEGRPELLRLTEGLALRMAGRTRYVCPALFDSDVTPRAAALPGGEALVVSGGDAYLMFADGAVKPHPDPTVRSGTIRALEAARDGVYALRSSASGVELLALDARRAQVLAELPAGFASLAADDSGVLAAGLGAEGRVLQRGFEPDGAEHDAWTGEATGPLDAAGVFARLVQGRPYLLVAAADGLGSELARVDDGGAYRVVQRAGGTISGPIAAGARTWFAFDGRLAELRAGDEVVRREDGEVVTCVGRSGALAYACAGTELRQLQEGALGERLFGLDEVEPPDLSGLASAVAERCQLQWLRFRVDLVGAGVTPNDDGGGAPVGSGRDAGDRDHGAGRDAGALRDAGPSARGDDATGEDSGCAVVAGGARGSGCGARGVGAGFALMLALCVRLIRSRQRRA